MNKHRHLPLTFGFLIMAASTAAGQIKPPADQFNMTSPLNGLFNTTANPFNAATGPFTAGQFNTSTGPYNSPFNTTASPFNTATGLFNAGQVNTSTGRFKT